MCVCACVRVCLCACLRVFACVRVGLGQTDKRNVTSVQKEDKVVCEELARRAGMAIDNAQLYHAADSANQAKDSFLAALSHELRTPLTPALLLSESLLSTCVCTLSVVRASFKTLTVLTYDTAEGALSERAEESMQMIHESVELEVRLIDDLLDFTKISRYARPRPQLIFHSRANRATTKTRPSFTHSFVTCPETS